MITDTTMTTKPNRIAEALRAWRTVPRRGPQPARACAPAALLVALAATACELERAGPDEPVAAAITAASGDEQSADVTSALPQPLVAVVHDAVGAPLPGVAVFWSVVAGGGSVSPASTTSGPDGSATAFATLGPLAGENTFRAAVSGTTLEVTFSATAQAGPGTFHVRAGGNNVPNRYSSDLWVHGGFAYTGTWGFRSEQGNALNVWQLDGNGAPHFVRAIVTSGIGTVSDVEVSADGSLLLFSAEGGASAGLHLYSLADPGDPTFIAMRPVSTGLHTVTFGYIDGRQYAFAAKNPSDPALRIYEIDPSATEPIALVSQVAIPANYGIHDTFVRDGIAIVFAWNTGVIIYDVGNGTHGGSPAHPVEISRLVTPNHGVPGGSAVHNGWWFHNPVSGEQRYLFIGQEGPGATGATSSGDLHVLDVSDLANPHAVAHYRMEGAGAHNFWMDESKQILYAAFYNGGVVALDVSGTLSGDLANREIGRIRPGGTGNTYVWGVQLYGDSLYAIDMLSGLWQLSAF
jgi:hypothetical protein